MKTTSKVVLLGLAAGLILAGCANAGAGANQNRSKSQNAGGYDFTIKEIQPQAKWVAFVDKKPEGCIYRGYKEGREIIENASGASFALMRNSAKNDLQNEASLLATKGKRAVVFITRQETICTMDANGIEREISCSQRPKNAAFRISSYTIRGDVYECDW